MKKYNEEILPARYQSYLTEYDTQISELHARLMTQYNQQIQSQYDNYVADYNANVEAYEAKVEKKTNTCSAASAVGATVARISGVDINYSQYLTYRKVRSVSKMKAFFETYLRGSDSPTYDECMTSDCLHKCYGAAHESNCNTCFNAAFDPRYKGTEAHLKICGGCSKDPQEYQLPELLTLDEIK